MNHLIVAVLLAIGLVEGNLGGPYTKAVLHDRLRSSLYVFEVSGVTRYDLPSEVKIDVGSFPLRFWDQIIAVSDGRYGYVFGVTGYAMEYGPTLVRLDLDNLTMVSLHLNGSSDGFDFSLRGAVVAAEFGYFATDHFIAKVNLLDLTVVRTFSLNNIGRSAASIQSLTVFNSHLLVALSTSPSLLSLTFSFKVESESIVLDSSTSITSMIVGTTANATKVLYVLLSNGTLQQRDLSSGMTMDTLHSATLGVSRPVDPLSVSMYIHNSTLLVWDRYTIGTLNLQSLTTIGARQHNFQCRSFNIVNSTHGWFCAELMDFQLAAAAQTPVQPDEGGVNLAAIIVVAIFGATFLLPLLRRLCITIPAESSELKVEEVESKSPKVVMPTSDADAESRRKPEPESENTQKDSHQEKDEPMPITVIAKKEQDEEKRSEDAKASDHEIVKEKEDEPSTCKLLYKRVKAGSAVLTLFFSIICHAAILNSVWESHRLLLGWTQYTLYSSPDGFIFTPIALLDKYQFSSCVFGSFQAGQQPLEIRLSSSPESSSGRIGIFALPVFAVKLITDAMSSLATIYLYFNPRVEKEFEDKRNSCCGIGPLRLSRLLTLYSLLGPLFMMLCVYPFSWGFKNSLQPLTIRPPTDFVSFAPGNPPIVPFEASHGSNNAYYVSKDSLLLVLLGFIFVDLVAVGEVLNFAIVFLTRPRETQDASSCKTTVLFFFFTFIIVGQACCAGFSWQALFQVTSLSSVDLKNVFSLGIPSYSELSFNSLVAVPLWVGLQALVSAITVAITTIFGVASRCLA